MPILNKPDMNHGVWAEGGNIEIPSSEKVEQGWIIEKPLNETMNWLQNRQDRMLQYLNQRGIPEWDFNTEYPVNSFVARSGTIYQAISQNQDADPTLNQSIWKIAFVSYEDFLNYSNKVANIETQDGYLSYYVKKSDPVFDAPTKGSEYNDTTNSSGYQFVGTTPVISTDGVTIAEFSGGTNPKDVVTHEQLAIAIQNYKVGDIYITTASGDPSDRLGYGIWERFGKGRTLVGFTDEVSNDIPEWVKTAGISFGEYEHELTQEELAKHEHRLLLQRRSGGKTPSPIDIDTSVRGDFSNVGIDGDDIMESVGEGVPHNNVQPSIVVYFWKRIA